MRVTTIIPTKNNDTDTDPAVTPMELLAEVEWTDGVLEGAAAVEVAEVEVAEVERVVEVEVAALW